MSEATSETPTEVTPEVTQSVTPEATAPVVPTVELDEFAQQAKERISATIAELNTVNNQIKASSGSPDEILEALESSHSDNGGEFDKLQATITKLDKALDAAIAQRKEMLKPVVESMTGEATQNIQPLLDKAAALNKTVTNGKNYLTGIYGDAAIADLPEVVKVRRSTAGAGAGSKRIRGFESYVNGKIATQKNAQGADVSNMSAAARMIGVDTKVVQEAFWTAQGTQDATKFKDSVEFEVKNGDTAYTVLCRKPDEVTVDDSTTETTAA